MDNFLGKNDERIRCRGILHVVENGDTLYKIAKKYGVPLSRVMYANPYVDVYNLQIGDEICVPIQVPRPPMLNCPGGMRPPVQSYPREMRPPVQEERTDNREPLMQEERTDNREPPMAMPIPVQENRADMVNEMAPPIQGNYSNEMAPPIQGNYSNETGAPWMGNCPMERCPRMSDGQMNSRTAMPWNHQQSDEQMLEDYLNQNPR